MIRAPLVSRRAYDLALRQLDAAELRCSELHELVKSLATKPTQIATPATALSESLPADPDIHPDVLDVAASYGRPGTEVYRQLVTFARAQRAMGRSPEEIITGIRTGGGEVEDDEPLELGVGA